MADRHGRILGTFLANAGAAVLVAFGVTSAAAGDDLAACRAISDDRGRLACYDALADALADAAPSPGATAPRLATPTATDLFGLDSSSAVAGLGAAAGINPLDELVATVTGVARAADGRLSVDLDNGQSWVQVDTRRATLSTGVEVRIRRAAFGSYLLSPTGDRRSALRVRRIR